MDVNASSWLVILLAVVAANLPFLNEKVFALVPLKAANKPFVVRLAELAVLYVVIGGIGIARGLSRRVFGIRQGRPSPQLVGTCGLLFARAVWSFDRMGFALDVLSCQARRSGAA